MIYVLSFLFCIYSIYVYIKYVPKPELIDHLIVYAVLVMSIIPVVNTVLAIFCLINIIAVLVAIKAVD